MLEVDAINSITKKYNAIRRLNIEIDSSLFRFALLKYEYDKLWDIIRDEKLSETEKNIKMRAACADLGAEVMTFMVAAL